MQRNLRLQALAEWLASGNQMPEFIRGTVSFPAGRTIFCSPEGHVYLDQAYTIRVPEQLSCGGKRYAALNLPREIVGPFSAMRFNTHPLIALAYLPQIQYSTIDHIDGNRINNHVNNLQRVSQAENNRRARRRKTLVNVSEANKNNRDVWLQSHSTESRRIDRERVKAFVRELQALPQVLTADLQVC